MMEGFMNTRRHLLGIVLAASLSGLACLASYPPGPYDEPDYRYSHPYSPPHDARYGYSTERFAALAHELDHRAARAHQLAEELAARSGPRERASFGRIHPSSVQTRALDQRDESG